MDTNTLIELIKTVSKTLNDEGFEHIELNHEGSSLVLNKRSVANVTGNVYSQPPMGHMNYQQESVVSQSEVLPKKTDVVAEPVQNSTPKEEGNFTTIDSPIVGTFYNAPSPDAQPYVKVGDKVNKGDVVCIIEAMKLMNEIEADCDGVVSEILLSNEDPVEYGQPLIKLKQ